MRCDAKQMEAEMQMQIHLVAMQKEPKDAKRVRHWGPWQVASDGQLRYNYVSSICQWTYKKVWNIYVCVWKNIKK